jgi:hypothetical protein
MKLKQLESLLEDVESFAAPKISLEQYATGAHLAAHISAGARAAVRARGAALAARAQVRRVPRAPAPLRALPLSLSGFSARKDPHFRTVEMFFCLNITPLWKVG